jgi:S-methylmethionine-dependent homocysteine/selenocysteine methylase
MKPIDPSNAPSRVAAARQQLERLLAERILVLDGAMGTMVHAHKFTEADFRGQQFAKHPKDLKNLIDVLVLTQPEAIKEIHRQYLEAGADIIETNTFGATAIAMSDFDEPPHARVAAVCGWLDRADESAAFDRGQCERPRLPRGHFRSNGRDLL